MQVRDRQWQQPLSLKGRPGYTEYISAYLGLPFIYCYLPQLPSAEKTIANPYNQSQITVGSKGGFACVRVLHERTHKHHKQRHIHFAVLLGFFNQFQMDQCCISEAIRYLQASSRSRLLMAIVAFIR